LTALAGIITRSSGLAIMFSFIVLITSSPLENREKTLFLLWNNEIYHRILDIIYYILPQLSAMLSNSSRLIGETVIQRQSGDFTIFPFISSLASASVFYGISIWYFKRQDY
jgi:ABC-type transport system involved in multi-copper enzyme maturation permease subunit